MSDAVEGLISGGRDDSADPDEIAAARAEIAARAAVERASTRAEAERRKVKLDEWWKAYDDKRASGAKGVRPMQRIRHSIPREPVPKTHPWNMGGDLC